MGFSNAIYKYPIYKDTTYGQIYAIEDYYRYFESEWAQNNYASAEEYMIKQHESYKDFVKPTQDQIDFYKSFVHKDEYNEVTISDYVYYNCSGGSQLDEDIRDLFPESHSNYGTSLVLTQDKLIKLLVNEIKKLDKYKLVPVNINYSFISNDDDDEDRSITLKKCDGVEVEYEGGITRRLYTNCEYDDWGTSLMTTKDYVDEYDSYNQFYAIEALSSILETTDFSKEALYYSGGW